MTTRRSLLGMVLAAAVATTAHGDPTAERWVAPALDPPRFELVMRIVVTCSSPEPMDPGGAAGKGASKDGQRSRIWPIIGGRVYGKDFQGTVVPGGGDFPVTRPDGVTVVDALYRLRTDDGTTIIIHNKGLAYPAEGAEPRKYRLVPEFTAPQGKYDWLNKQVFVSTLVVPVPKELQLAKGPNENDRLIEVYRVL
jgi:hypothetical protein